MRCRSAARSRARCRDRPLAEQFQILDANPDFAEASQRHRVVERVAGIARGKVVGKTDKIGGTVADRPVSPKDVLATVYHLLGYDLETLLRDRTNRPQPLVPGGSVVTEMFA